MVLPREIEHTKNYLINLELYDNSIFGEPVDLRLNYLATGFEIYHVGGSDFINQKGRQIATAFAKQPSVSVSIDCYMREVDFSIILSRLITNQQELLITIGRLPTVFKDTRLDIDTEIEPSQIICEIIGYIRDARIIGKAGDFVTVSFTVNADDVRELDPNAVLTYNP